MKDSIKNRKKQLLALCLSAMMLSSAVALAACKDDSTDSSSSSSSSSTTSTQKDTGLIKNADFEIVSGEDLITTSVSDWTNARTSDSNGSATTSTAQSGIVDLNEDAWADLTTSKYTATTAEDAEANWSKMTTKDKLAFYKQWKDDNSGKTISTELKDFYESFNIDAGDTFEMAHFDTHDGAVADWKAAKDNGATDEELDEFDTKVLMIHNQNGETTTVGTGQQYTSSSTVTVPAGTSAEFSVWVKTANLQTADSYGNTQEAVNKGAFISVTNTVGSTALDQYTVKNINTEIMDDLSATNGWKQYKFLLKGSSYADTTFTMVLGLGRGSSTNRAEYVNGFAFFDDIECKIVEESALVADHTATFDSEGDDKIVNVYEDKDLDTFALDFYGAFTADPAILSLTTDNKVTTTEIGFQKIPYTSQSGNSPAPGLEGGFNGDNDVVEILPNGVKADDPNALISKLASKYFSDADRYKDYPTLLLLSENGVAYTAKSTKTFTLAPESRLAVSFLVKTSAMKGKTGAGITLSVKDDDKTKASFSSIDTTTATPVTVNDEDIYEGWQKYFFFVENTSTEDKELSLAFHFGPTEITSSLTKDNFIGGFATFTDFQTKTMTKDEFESVQSGTYAQILSITDEEDEKVTTDPFDSAMGTPSNALEEGLAKLSNYKGVYWNSRLLTGEKDDDASFNQYANAGLIGEEYFSDYFADTDKDWLTALKTANPGMTAEELWASVFGNTSTPLFIWNDGSAEQLANAYGYIGSSKTISANTYSAITLAVKGTAGASAYLRLVDTNADDYDDFKAFKNTLSVGRNLTYWYDDDGNIYDGDPAKATSKQAFKLQSNGLYKASTKWSGYASLTDEQKNAYFANLQAYEKDAAGNLLVAKNGAAHDYNTVYNNQRLIAFYYKDGKYYADGNRTIQVLDLKDTSVTKRFDAIDASTQTLDAEVTLSAEWTYVTFFIHTGDVAKNYRLEIFSGKKDGSANASGDYLIVDTANYGTAQDNFTGLLASETYTDAVADADKSKSVFSYFDTASYLRYDASLDENNVGNLYEENYTASAQTEGYAYLRYNVGNEYSVFADYSYTEKAVTASEAEEDTDENTDDSTEDESSASSFWLGISSVAVAGVLLLALVSIVVRKMIAKARRNRTAQHSPKAKK